MESVSQIDPVELLSDLTVTAFVLSLAASVLVAASMIMLPLVDLAFEKAKANPKETEHHDSRTAQHARWQLSGSPWLALRSYSSRPEAAVPEPQMGMPHHPLADPPLERITPIINRSLAPKRAGTLRVLDNVDSLEASDGIAGRFTPILLASAQDHAQR